MGASAPQANDGQDYDVVHARILRFLPELVRQLGGDPSALAAAVGIDPDRAWEAISGATYRQAIHLIELAATELGCPDFGMRLASRQQGAGMFGPLGEVMKSSRTFGEALDYVGQHNYAHSLAARIWRKPIGDEKKEVFCGHDILVEGLPHKSQAIEHIMLVGHLAAMEITGGEARVRGVHFRHQPLSPPKVYRRYFGCDVRFGQEQDGVIFSEWDLARPIVDRDAQIYQAATEFIEARFTRRRPPVHALVRGIVMQTLGTERCRNDAVAEELNMHVRTMHRRLKKEGTSFQQIKDEVRRDFMIYYLEETGLDFAYISERLGFAEQSVMTRSCNRWFSSSPTRVRERAS